MSRRLRIAKGTARGLAYLHECSPQISSSTTNSIHTSRITGTDPSSSGYQKPEYSFGVVLLQLLTGKSPEVISTEIQDVVKWVTKGFEDEISLFEMVDPALLQEVHAKKELTMKYVYDNLDRLGS